MFCKKHMCYGKVEVLRCGKSHANTRNKTVEIGGSVNLTCGVSGNPLPNIEWYFPPGVSHRISEYKEILINDCLIGHFFILTLKL